jgi:transcriptional regulator NrdR family protein
MTINEKNSQKPKPKRRRTKCKKTPQRLSLLEKADCGVQVVKDQRFKERWLELNSDVRSALGSWNDLTEKYDGKMNRDQEQLHEIKSLLQELQKKLKVFSE